MTAYGKQKYSGLDSPTHPISSVVNKVFPHISRFLNKRETVLLDLGCGNGRFSNLYSKMCSKVVAIDPVDDFSESFLHENIQFFKQDVMSHDPKEQYDIIWCHGSMYQVAEGHGTKGIQKVISLLKPDGLLIVLEGAQRKYLRNFVEKSEELQHIVSQKLECSSWDSLFGYLQVIKKVKV